jgi:hypothetical protein
MFKIIQVVTGLYDRTSEQHANSQTICSTHIRACDKCKFNPCVKWARNVQKISFQLSVDTGKNKVRSFYNYFYKLYMNLILTQFMCWYAISIFHWLNALLHKSQQYGHWPVHMGCVIKWLCIINDILHTSQQFGCSTLCKHLCYKATPMSESLAAHITAIWVLTNM